MAADPKVIYLAPMCGVDWQEGRLWCQDDVFECECGAEPPHRPTAYMRADIANGSIAVMVLLRLACERLLNDTMHRDHPEASDMAKHALNEAARLTHGL